MTKSYFPFFLADGQGNGEENDLVDLDVVGGDGFPAPAWMERLRPWGWGTQL